MDGLSHLATDLIEIASVVGKQNNDLGTLASYSQKETSELAEACLIHAGKVRHKKPVAVDGVIDELADSIQSAFVLACETLSIDPLSVMGLLQKKLKHKNEVWMDIIREDHDAVEEMHTIAVANRTSDEAQHSSVEARYPSDDRKQQDAMLDSTCIGGCDVDPTE